MGPVPTARWATHNRPTALPLRRFGWSGAPVFVPQLQGGRGAAMGPRLKHGVLEREVVFVPNLILNKH